MKETLEKLSLVKHPEINSSLVELGMIGRIDRTDGKLSVEMKVPFAEIPIRGQLEAMIREALADEGDVDVVTSVMSADEKTKFLELAQKNWAL